MKGSMNGINVEDQDEKLKQQVNWEEMHRNKSKIFGVGAKMLDRDSIRNYKSFYPTFSVQPANN